MAITMLTPGTVYLGGEKTDVCDKAASETITPGDLIDLFNSSGTIRFRKQATASIGTPVIIAKEASMLGRSWSDTYVVNDLMEAFVCQPGCTFMGWIESGQNLVAGNKVEANGSGGFKVYSSGVALATVQENTGAVTVRTRVRLEAM